MTDDELLSVLKRADDLLGEYKKMLEPVLEELARRFSMDMFGVPDKATAEFGHEEAGVDVITLRLLCDAEEEEKGKIANITTFAGRRAWIDKKYGWDTPFCQKMIEVGIGRIGVTTL